MNLRSARFPWIALVFVGLFLGTLHGQSYTSFEVPEAAPATAGSLSVNDINRLGVISGYLVDTSGNTKGWVRDTGGNITLLVDPLDTTAPSTTLAYNTNAEDVTVGYFLDTSASLYYGFFYHSGTYTTYSAPGQPTGTDTAIFGINNHRQFCGIVLPPPYSTYQAFISINGAITQFSVNGSSVTECLAINNTNATVGYYADSAGVNHGWKRLPSGKIATINVPGASSALGSPPCTTGKAAGTVTEGINDAGYISGHYWDKSYNEHGFVRTPAGQFLILDVPGANQTSGGGLNNAGEVVGHWSDSSCNNAGYIYTPATNPAAE